MTPNASAVEQFGYIYSLCQVFIRVRRVTALLLILYCPTNLFSLQAVQEQHLPRTSKPKHLAVILECYRVQKQHNNEKIVSKSLETMKR